MKRSLAGLALALLVALPVAAAAPSISVDQPGPYHWGDTVTLTVEVPKLKGYEYPVVIIDCRPAPSEGWYYWRRWDDKGINFPILTGPEPVLLGGGQSWPAADCAVQLWAYRGLHSGGPDLLASGPAIHVDP